MQVGVAGNDNVNGIEPDVNFPPSNTFINGIPVYESHCPCDVCYNPFGEISAHRARDVHERCGDLFTDYDVGGVNSGAYTSVLSSLNNQDLERIKENDDLKLVDNKIVLSRSVSCSVKLVVAFAVLLSLLLMTFIVFAVITHKGIVHISGMNPEVVGDLTKLIGVGLCVASFGYVLLVLGYLIGSVVEGNNKRCKPIINYYESRMRKYSIVQKKLSSDLDRCNRKMQSSIFYLRLASVSVGSRRPDLLKWQWEHLSTSISHRELNLHLESIDSEIAELRNNNDTKIIECNALAEKNTKLSNDNDAIRSKLSNLSSTFR